MDSRDNNPGSSLIDPNANQDKKRNIKELGTSTFDQMTSKGDFYDHLKSFLGYCKYNTILRLIIFRYVFLPDVHQGFRQAGTARGKAAAEAEGGQLHQRGQVRRALGQEAIQRFAGAGRDEAIFP